MNSEVLVHLKNIEIPDIFVYIYTSVYIYQVWLLSSIILTRIHVRQQTHNTCKQGRLISSIGPRARQCRNKAVTVDKIKHIFIILVLPTKSAMKY